MKKISVLILTLALIICSLGMIPTSAASATSYWDGVLPTAPYSFLGKGTIDKPYVINSAADLAGLAYNVNAMVDYTGMYFILNVDIDLCDKPWTPIGGNGNDGAYFSGTFDGNYHTISNLKVSSENDGVGLFGAAGNAIIKNLGVVSGNVNGGQSAGGIVGLGKDIMTFTNCFNMATVTATSTTDHVSAGGIVGFMGSNIALVVSYCYNGGDITGVTSSDKYCRVGGLIGASTGTAATKELTDSYNTGNITCSGKDILNSRAGGLAGAIMDNVTVANCHSSAIITVINMETTTAIRLGTLVGSYKSHRVNENNLGEFTNSTYVAQEGIAACGYPEAEFVSGVTAVASITVPFANSSYSFLQYQTPAEADTTPSEQPAETTPEVTTPVETTPVETTPAETTPAEVAEETVPTEVDVDTAPASETPATTNEGGCGSALAVLPCVAALIGGLVIALKRKEN